MYIYIYIYVKRSRAPSRPVRARGAGARASPTSSSPPHLSENEFYGLIGLGTSTPTSDYEAQLGTHNFNLVPTLRIAVERNRSR